ncbi:hypothetical protein [Streptomyces sp. TRM70350]|uniref:hypothetical protein n=1 Tax=Streptomyces sp. TRM70350 TaxID=2856165 RepID=UPI002110C6ED|nr:hypothetical protein [Streptomyces sp. TRM70350]
MRTNKAMGLHNLLALRDHADLVDAEPGTMCFRLYHLPARLTKHARRHLEPGAAAASRDGPPPTSGDIMGEPSSHSATEPR